MKNKFVGIFFIAAGAAVIGGGILAEVAWLGLCFGTVIIGLLMLLFSPGLLLMPFTFLVASGTALSGTGVALISTQDEQTPVRQSR
jgi:hypothetical protein